MLLRYLLEKEFKQIRCNPFLPRLIVAYPFLVMLVFQWVVKLEVRYVNFCVIDNYHSVYSRGWSSRFRFRGISICRRLPALTSRQWRAYNGVSPT
jgi:ABC-2 type transport system permease protein